MARETMLTERTLEGFSGGELMHQSAELSFLIGGESYIVVWDGTEYVCVALDNGEGGIFVGNFGMLGETDTGEPFLLGYATPEASNISTGLSLYGTTDGEATSHTVAIYQEETLARTTIFAEQTITDFVYSEEYGCYLTEIYPSTVTLVAGEKYEVVWNGEAFSCEAVDVGSLFETGVVIGNGTAFGFSGNNEPFIIVTVPINEAMILVSLEGKTENTVAIYQDSSSMKTTPLFEEQTVEGFSYHSAYGCYKYDVRPVPGSLADGQEYIVLWDGKKYTRTAFGFAAADGSNCVGIGNPLAAGGEDNGDKFAIVYDQTHNYMYFFSLETDSSHVIGLYIIEEEVIDGIVIRDPLGRTVTYGEYKKIILNRSSGKKTIYSEGENIGTVSIDLDFSDDKDMVVNSAEGTLMDSVNIKKPETLIPENIPEGTNIAGVIGSKKINTTIDISTELEMNNLLVAENVGKVYRYIGETTDNYINGDIYIVEEVE